VTGCGKFHHSAGIFTLYTYCICKMPVFRSCRMFRCATKATLKYIAPHDSLHHHKNSAFNAEQIGASLRSVGPLPNLCGVDAGQKPNFAEDGGPAPHYKSVHNNCYVVDDIRASLSGG
jgi:hypothetical protein